MTSKIDATPDGRPGLAWLPLFLALVILVVMTILPGVATDHSGKADHPAAMLLFGAMSAGFVRGVGFIPANLVGRVLLSGQASLVLFLMAIFRLFQIGRLPISF